MPKTDSGFVTSVSGSTITITAGAELRDRTWSLTFGSAQRALRKSPKNTLKVNLSHVEWADPLPLLALACAIREFEAICVTPKIEIQLGAPRRGVADRFLKFLATQGFLRSLTSTGVLIWRSRRFRVQENDQIEILIDELSNLRAPAAYDKSDCIPVGIFDIGDYEHTSSRDFVEGLVEQASRFGVGQWLARNSRHRAFVLQKLRVILTELVDNTIEHAYEQKTQRFGAVYARIRSGAPDDAASFDQWRLLRTKESLHCPSISRANYGKKPGWLELFVCDVGCGLMHYLPGQTTKTPLTRDAQKVFREPVSRYRDRAASHKTSVTGLQHIGYVLEAGPEEPIRSDFVRIYSNGEWLGEHFPWPPPSVTAYHEHYVDHPDHSKGTYFTFCLEPPVSDHLSASEMYPPFFFIPKNIDLSDVRQTLSQPLSLHIRAHGFSDQLPNYASAQRGVALQEWIAELDYEVGLIRPARTIRKADLLALLEELAKRLNRGESRLSSLIFADVPTFLAIDLAYLLRDSRLKERWPRDVLYVHVVTQDWTVASYKLGRDRQVFEVDSQIAKAFVNGQLPSFSAADVAASLRKVDSQDFWSNVRDAYVNEPIIWGSREIVGYLDLPQALVDRNCFHAAQRALRRALRAHRIEIILTADSLIGSLLTDEFELADGATSLEHTRGRMVVVAGSIKVTGTTTKRFWKRRDISIGAVAHLLTRDDPIAWDDSQAGTEEVVALEWRAPPQPTQDTQARVRRPRKYERIAGTPFVIRGGEGAIPLPRFAAPKEDNEYSVSLYGETPNQAYEEWQKRGLLKLGHWVYGGRHDLLTINLLEAIKTDSSGKMISWLIDALGRIRASAPSSHEMLLLYPSHTVTDRIVRQLQRLDASPIPGSQIYALKVVRHQAVSPLLVSPVERDRLGGAFRRLAKGAVVVLFDDGTVTGKSLAELQQFVEALWLQVHIDEPHIQQLLEIRTVALIDRTGLPTNRSLVAAFVAQNPRFWRWDVPALGNARSCTLCAALSRTRYIKDRIVIRDLVARLELREQHWRPQSVLSDWSEGGLQPDVLPAGDFSRFGTEVGAGGRRIAHSVKHRISTSRAAIAIELFRSTTRRDYHLDRVRSGRTGKGLALTSQTRIEILCSIILLYWDDLDYQEKLDRFELLLDLVWMEHSATLGTEIAALSLSLPEGALAEDLAQHVRGLIERLGLPNDDAFLIASALTWQTDGRLLPKGVQSRIEWSLIRMVTSTGKGIRGALSRIFHVIGWDDHSFHSGWLVRFFTARGTARRPQDVQLMATMVESLAAALDDLPAECVASWSDESQFPSVDAAQLRELLGQLRELGDLGGHVPVSSRYAQICLEKPRELEQVLQKVRASLFDDGRLTAIRQRYRKSLTLQLLPGQAKFHALEKILAQVLNKWSGAMRHIAPERSLDVNSLVVRGAPVFLAFPGRWGQSLPMIYWDALVQQCVAEVASNVMHSSGRLRCPWATEVSGTADMWYRLELEKNEEGDDELVIEFCNEATGHASIGYRKGTLPSRHLINLGGSITDPRLEGNLVFVKMTIPAITALAWE